MAERCGSEHRERFVINECGSSGSSDALAAAQANELYLRRECGATCVFDPAMPPDDVDPLLTLAAARCAATARMLVSRDARVDALPLGRYLAVDPAER